MLWKKSIGCSPLTRELRVQFQNASLGKEHLSSDLDWVGISQERGVTGVCEGQYKWRIWVQSLLSPFLPPSCTVRGFRLLCVNTHTRNSQVLNPSQRKQPSKGIHSVTWCILNMANSEKRLLTGSKSWVPRERPGNGYTTWASGKHLVLCEHLISVWKWRRKKPEWVFIKCWPGRVNCCRVNCLAGSIAWQGQLPLDNTSPSPRQELFMCRLCNLEVGTCISEFSWNLIQNCLSLHLCACSSQLPSASWRNS